jgi:hypothetical protein
LIGEGNAILGGLECGLSLSAAAESDPILPRRGSSAEESADGGEDVGGVQNRGGCGRLHCMLKSSRYIYISP